MARPAANPNRFVEAVRWFRARVAVPDTEFAKLSEQARVHAFKVAGVAQLDAVADIWRAVDKAIANGTTLAQFRKEVRAKLLAAWGGVEPRGRIETIFRTNVQHAYAAGRFRQAADPAVLRARPYWRFSAILDSRTTEICRPLDGAVRPANDPWWHSHYPPLHFNCRSSVQTLAKASGALEETEDLPDVRAQKGFGRLPQLDDWEPDLSGIPPELVAAFRRKAGRVAAPRPVPAPPPPEEPKEPKVSNPKGYALFRRRRAKWEKNGELAGVEPYNAAEFYTPEWVERVKDAPITINLKPKALESVLAEGGFRNLFATGDKKFGTGGGNPSKRTRRYQEERVLELPESERFDKARPIYGALHVLEDHPEYGSQGGATYGRSWVKLRPEVRARSSFTPLDSFSARPAQVFTDKHPEALAHEARILEQARISAGAPLPTGSTKSFHGYIEAQVWGGVSLDDISEIHVPRADYQGNARLQERIKQAQQKHGIRVVIEPD